MQASTPFFDEMDALVQRATAASGRAGLTTHEAREYFRRAGHSEDDERLHALLILLAADSSTAAPAIQDLASAPK